MRPAHGRCITAACRGRGGGDVSHSRDGGGRRAGGFRAARPTARATPVTEDKGDGERALSGRGAKDRTTRSFVDFLAGGFDEPG
jgi:hypothetical protein